MTTQMQASVRQMVEALAYEIGIDEHTIWTRIHSVTNSDMSYDEYYNVAVIVIDQLRSEHAPIEQEPLDLTLLD